MVPDVTNKNDEKTQLLPLAGLLPPGGGRQAMGKLVSDKDAQKGRQEYLEGTFAGGA